MDHHWKGLGGGYPMDACRSRIAAHHADKTVNFCPFRMILGPKSPSGNAESPVSHRGGARNHETEKTIVKAEWKGYHG
jgi:hypothetical protein